MAEFITLSQFQATQRHYHIYKLRKVDMAHKSHYHNYYQVCYVVSGELTHRQNREAVSLKAGDAFIVPPDFIHSLHIENSHTEMYSLAFDEGLFSPGFPQSNAYQFLKSLQSQIADANESVRLRVTLDQQQRKLMENLLDGLLHQQQENIPTGFSAAPSLTASILYLLSQGYYRQVQNAPELDALIPYNDTLLQCVQYIDSHFRESVSLDMITKRFGLSRSSFCSVFPQFTGMPLRRYVANKRIKEAQALMRAHPERSISQIASQVGYNDDSTFYRNFLRITGVPPLKYKSSFHTPEP